MRSHDKTVIRKRFFIRTFGCKVNQYETQAMREMLLRAGYTEAASREDAGVCIVNTCTVTETADREARSYISLLNRVNPDARIVVTGCLAARDGDPVMTAPGVSRVVRNEDKARLADIIDGGGCDGARLASGAAPAVLRISSFKDRTKAFLKIQDGCENFCSYCAVPYARGRVSSKPVPAITDEIAGLAANGYREIVLTGICLGAWGADLSPAAGLIDALRAIDAVPGDFRIRLSSIELAYVTDELTAYMAGNPRMCPHLHIPLQSGDDSILKRMNRPYTAGRFREVIARARERIPGLAVTTDVMVGFPGETDLDFAGTVRLVREIRPLRVHVFTFSRREGTPASRMEGSCGERVMKERHRELEALSLELSVANRRAMIGTTARVLVESRRDRSTGRLCGYAGNYVRILFDGPDSIMNTIVSVTIKEVIGRSTMGIYER